MTRRVPIIPTIIVAAAVATMVWLGFWQIDRLKWKESLLARYEAARAMSADAPWPVDAAALEAVAYRHTHLTCFSPGPDAPVTGRNAAGEAGWAHVFSCDLEGGGKASVVMGWSQDSAPRTFEGGRVRGVISPGGRLVLDPDLILEGLQPNAYPDPGDLPNNHLAYAVQWFFFALTALVIYVLALRKRWRE